jgi:hypothetical protein
MFRRNHDRLIEVGDQDEISNDHTLVSSLPGVVPPLRQPNNNQENISTSQYCVPAELLNGPKFSSMLSDLFSKPGIRETILFELSHNDRRKLRLIDKRINDYLWQVIVRRKLDQFFITDVQQYTLNLGSDPELSMTFFINKNGSLYLHLTDYQNSAIKEISLPNQEKVIQITHKPCGSATCSFLLSNLGNIYLLEYLIYRASLDDEKFISPPQRTLCKLINDKIIERVDIGGDIIYLSETGNVYTVNPHSVAPHDNPFIQIHLPNNQKVKQLYCSPYKFLLLLSNSGRIYFFNGVAFEEFTKFCQGKVEVLALPALMTLPRELNIKCFSDANFDAKTMGLFLITEEDKLYQLDSVYDLEVRAFNFSHLICTEINLPDQIKPKQIFQGRDRIVGITKCGALYEFKKAVDSNEPILKIIALPQNEKASKVYLNYDATFLATNSGAVYVSGENKFGELIVNHKNPVHRPTSLKIFKTSEDFYQLRSQQHLHWFNCWSAQTGSDFERVLALIKIYIANTYKNNQMPFTLSCQPQTQANYAFQLQLIVDKFSNDCNIKGSSQNDVDRFNLFIEQLSLTLSTTNINRKSNLYALFDVLQLETNREMLSKRNMNSQTEAAQDSCSNSEEMSALHPPHA